MHRLSNRSLLGVHLFFLGLFIQPAAPGFAQSYQFRVIDPFQPNGINDLEVTVGQGGAPIQAVYRFGRFFTHVNDPMLSQTGNTLLTGVNNQGVIVGQSDVRGFVLADGVFTTLTVPGADVVLPSSINDLGVIAGTYLVGSGSFGFVRIGNQVRVFPNPVSGINNHGDIVGNLAGGGYLLANGVTTPINVPGSIGTEVLGINAGKTIVGFYTDTQFISHGFAWNNGTFTTIDFPSANFTRTQAINNAGKIAGFALMPSGLTAFIATPKP